MLAGHKLSSHVTGKIHLYQLTFFSYGFSLLTVLKINKKDRFKEAREFDARINIQYTTQLHTTACRQSPFLSLYRVLRTLFRQNLSCCAVGLLWVDSVV